VFVHSPLHTCASRSHVALSPFPPNPPPLRLPLQKKTKNPTNQQNRRCFREETFGPLIPIFRFSTEDEAVALANDTEYGLAAYFYTRDLARAWRVAERLEYGMVGVNETAVGSEVAPFGGVKQSGYGVENSARGLEDYLTVKYVCMGLGRDGEDGV
jgi:acyl-CoA reductase-like NAD-dependent aldehyde dehydrogenase